MNQPQEQIEEILTAIRKACPELTELSFGCEVEVDGIRQDNPYCEKDVVIDNRFKQEGRILLGYYGLVSLDEIDVIGHEPTLQHLLRTLEKAGHSFCILTNGEIRPVYRHEVASWELGFQLDGNPTIDLTLSLRQNLENTDLREFIHSLLKI